jgi:hypothetical protein
MTFATAPLFSGVVLSDAANYNKTCACGALLGSGLDDYAEQGDGRAALGGENW